MFKVIEGNPTVMATFGGRLRRLREEKGLKQTELAKMLNFESSSTISQYENEELNRIPDAHILQKLADILDCSVDYLLARSDIRNPPPASPDPDIKDAPLAFYGNTEGLNIEELEKIINRAVKKALEEREKGKRGEREP